MYTYNQSQVIYPFLTLRKNYTINMNLNNKPNLHLNLGSIKINKYTILTILTILK